ncbi:hypothetical protein F5X68DRAFT_227827 [Plectosphaerella plurivora]|uniref:Chromo domain-containing protein n=1 Tax=Plectosphaerella plurivora TaxID=936078 RepID=A0A9P8VJE0_9PEZI|nr:hypothetical protein F5X68DRAFT_227827 [Plectosphaerella plurivora]
MPAATGSQSSRPTKRFRSTGPDDLHLASSPIAPQTVPLKRTLPFSGGASPRPASRESTVSRSHTDSAPVAPMAPMAPMDSPTTGAVLGSPIAEEISVSIQETVTVQTPAAALFGLGSKLVGVLTGQKAASPMDAIPVGRKRSIDEVDTPEETDHKGDDTAVELDNQLHDVAEARGAQPEQKSSPAPTASSPAPDSHNASKFIAANGSEDAADVTTDATTDPAVDSAAVSVADTPTDTPTDTAADAAAPPAADATPAVVSEPVTKQNSTTPRKRATRAVRSEAEDLASSVPTASKNAPKTKPSPRRQRARKSVNTADAEAVTAAVGETGDKPDEMGKFEVDSVVDYRYNANDPTLLDVQVSWADGERTWEPEANVQEDAPDALFKYWRSVKGGRASALNSDMWHVLRIEKHRVKAGDVSVHVAWIGSPLRSWEPEDAVAGYAGAHLDDYWDSLGGRDIIIGAQTVSPPKRRGRGRPPKSTTAKTPVAAKPATAATTKRQKRGADKPEVKAAPISTRPTRSSRR